MGLIVVTTTESLTDLLSLDICLELNNTSFPHNQEDQQFR